MRKYRHVVVGMLLAGSATADPVAAQSDILLRLRSGSPAGDRMRVDSAGSLVALGNLGVGIIPASGCGERMMWYGFKAAFRAGGTDDGGGCNYWDDANVGFYSWAGGIMSRASAYTTFAFGEGAVASSNFSIALGDGTVTSGQHGFGVGPLTTCSGFSCVAMGYTTTSSGQGSVALGYRVTADADYAVALGHRASANGRAGSFTWADASTTDSLESSANNSFQTRAAGGYRLYTNATTTTGVSMSAGGSSWIVISDRNRKSDFTLFGGESLLETLRRVPVTKWRYIDEEDRSTWHVGPMAQDWHAAFGLTTDDKTINTSDIDGVNLAAIQALETRTAKLREENGALGSRVSTLEAENAELRRRLERIEAMMKPREAGTR